MRIGIAARFADVGALQGEVEIAIGDVAHGVVGADRGRPLRHAGRLARQVESGRGLVVAVGLVDVRRGGIEAQIVGRLPACFEFEALGLLVARQDLVLRQIAVAGTVGNEH